MMNLTERDSLIETYRDQLLGDTLPFWIDHCVDHEFGGFTTSLDRDGTTIDTDKGVWQQGRFVWLLGELYNNVQRKSDWLELAISGGEFLETFCFDHADGRMWFQLTREGKPLRKRRYSFSEAFAAMAFGELFKATGIERYRRRAIDTFETFVSSQTQENAGTKKFTEVRPTRAIGHPMITINVAQQLRESIALDSANEHIDRCIALVRDLHVKPEIQCVMETVGIDGEIVDHFDGRMLNPGHAIEAAWFIMEEGQFRSDNTLIELGLKMLDWMWQRGWDSEFGGMLYFTDVNALPIQEYWHDMKFWWPQNETIIATLMAYKLTGDQKYADWHKQIHDWSYAHFPDAEHGEWFGYLHRDGRLSSRLKGNLWKGPFHLPRMQLKCWKLLESLNATDSPR